MRGELRLEMKRNSYGEKTRWKSSVPESARRCVKKERARVVLVCVRALRKQDTEKHK